VKHKKLYAYHIITIFSLAISNFFFFLFHKKKEKTFFDSSGKMDFLKNIKIKREKKLFISPFSLKND
jgi:hypothetical protein